MAADYPNSTPGRIPPHNLDAERALLGAMLLSAEVQIEASSRLQPEDFYPSAHQVIFNSMLDLAVRNTRFDHLSLAAKLESDGKLAAVGGHDYLVELSNNVTTTAFWEQYVDIVRRLATYRQLISAGTQIVALGYDAPADSAETVGRSEQLLFQVTERRVSSDFASLESQLMPALHRLEEAAQSKGGLVGVATGFNDLDKITSGFRAGDLVILAARPAVGKTSFALNVAVGAAKAGNSVAVFSLEMGVEDITQRILCSEALVNLQAVRAGRVPDPQWESIIDTMDRLSKLDIAIDDSPSLNITELRAKARRQLRNVNGKGMIIVDYLQLMSPTRKNSENRQVEIAEISRGLKILAKDLKVPIIALSQLSRAVESRSGKRPQLSDLRESGAIEQDADIVMFLDRNTDPDREGEEGRPERGTAELILAKHRNGPTGSVKLGFREMYTKFVPMAAKRVQE